MRYQMFSIAAIAVLLSFPAEAAHYRHHRTYTRGTTSLLPCRIAEMRLVGCQAATAMTGRYSTVTAIGLVLTGAQSLDMLEQVAKF
jgi:hypothetical protein